MESKEQLATTAFIFIIIIIQIIIVINLNYINNKIDEYENSNLEVHEYILNRIGG